MAQNQIGSPDFTVPVLQGKLFDDYWRRVFVQIRELLTYMQVTTALDFPNTLAQTSSDLPVTMNGVSAGDFAEISPASTPANTSFTVSSVTANTVTVRFNNYSAGAINPGSISFNIRVWKQ